MSLIISDTFLFTDSLGFSYNARTMFIAGSKIKVTTVLGVDYLYKLSEITYKNFVFPLFKDLMNELFRNGFTGNYNTQNVQVAKQVHVTASGIILPEWNGAIVIITAPGVVLTVPNDLPVIRFKIVTRPTATCDFTLTTPKVWVNGTPTLIPEKSEVEFLVDNVNSNEIYLSEPSASGGSIPTLQQVLDFNHSLDSGNNFQGTGAGINNTGSSVNALGNKSGQGNTGSSVNALGDAAGQGNTGSSVNVLGDAAGINNIGSSVNALGNSAGINNTFDHVNLFGNSAQADASSQTVFSNNSFVMARISYINLTQSRKYELPNADGTFSLVENSVQQGVNNNTTLALTSVQLTSLYPTATTGFKLYCTGIVAGKMIYEKTPTGWVGYTVLIP